MFYNPMMDDSLSQKKTTSIIKKESPLAPFFHVIILLYILKIVAYNHKKRKGDDYDRWSYAFRIRGFK